MTIQELRDRLAELSESANAIQATADAGKRDLSAEEAKQIDEIKAEFDAVKGDIARRESLAAMSAHVGDDTPQPRKVRPASAVDDDEPTAARAAKANGKRGVDTTMPSRDRARWGWQHFGDFCKAVYDIGVAPGRTPDPRLVQAASLTTYGDEGTGADGGFAVPPEWRATIMELVMGEDGLLGRTDQQQASGNTITFPQDETTAWQSSGGIQAYWDGEAASMSQSKPQILPKTVRLNRLTALVPVTDELLEDAPAMGSYVQRKAGEKITFKINDAIVNGDGAGMPLGLLNSPAKVSVAKESSQKAASVFPINIAKMWARMYGPSRRNAVWLVNQDVEPQLYTQLLVGTDVTGTTPVGAAYPAYLPAGGLSGAMYATLMGRPVITTEACATVGTIGDIILVDLSNYLTVVKATGLRSDVSIHLWFDQATTAFRFIYRLAGEPWLSKPIVRKNGTNTLSHIVTLDTRS